MKWFCLLLPALGPSVLAAGPCLSIADDEIRLSHLVELIPAVRQARQDVRLGYVPAPGVERILTREEIRSAARRAGLPEVETMNLCVKRAVAPIERAAVERAIAAAGVAAEVVAICDCLVPAGELELHASGLAAASGRELLWRGRWRYGGARSLPVWIKVRLREETAFVVAAEDLPAGRPIEAPQLRIERRPAAAAGRYLTEPSQAIGLVPRRRIRQGEALYASLLTLPEAVARGSTVDVTVESGGARLRFSAPAESSARVGETVLVRNPANGRRFRAVVEGANRVVVRTSGRTNET